MLTCSKQHQHTKDLTTYQFIRMTRYEVFIIQITPRKRKAKWLLQNVGYEGVN